MKRPREEFSFEDLAANLKPKRHRARWSDDDDNVLLAAIEVNVNNWGKTSNVVSKTLGITRTPEQCRNRFRTLQNQDARSKLLQDVGIQHLLIPEEIEDEMPRGQISVASLINIEDSADEGESTKREDLALPTTTRIDSPKAVEVREQHFASFQRKASAKAKQPEGTQSLTKAVVTVPKAPGKSSPSNAGRATALRRRQSGMESQFVLASTGKKDALLSTEESTEIETELAFQKEKEDLLSKEKNERKKQKVTDQKEQLQVILEAVGNQKSDARDAQTAHLNVLKELAREGNECTMKICETLVKTIERLFKGDR